MIKIINTFHNTEYYAKNKSLSGRTVAKIKNKLCGKANCCCGGTLSERGEYNKPAISDKKGNIYKCAPAPGFYYPISYGGGGIELRIVDNIVQGSTIVDWYVI